MGKDHCLGTRPRAEFVEEIRQENETWSENTGSLTKRTADPLPMLIPFIARRGPGIVKEEPKGVALDEKVMRLWQKDHPRSTDLMASLAPYF